MIHYIIQIVAFQLFFIIIYDVFLRKETFFNWNRTYLLGTTILSILLPFIKIESLKNALPKEYVINLPEVLIGQFSNQNQSSVTLQSLVFESQSFWSWPTLFYLGIGISATLFIYKMAKIIMLIVNNPNVREDNFLIVKLLNSSSAFSFLQYIFLGEKIEEEEKQSILKHEKVHVKQRHTLDLLFFEALRIVFWFNPLVYMFQNRIGELHEFIADAKASKNVHKSDYYQNLLSQVFDTKKVSFINPFFKKSLIKKRIIMLQKTKSKQIQLLKYVLLIPIVLGMLIYTSCSQEKNNSKVELEETFKIEKEATPLLKKVTAIKEQIQVQGNISEVEEAGLDLLFKVVVGKEFDPELVKQVHTYTGTKSQSKLTQKVSDVFEQIQIQGNISEEEEKQLKLLLLLTKKGAILNDSFKEVVEFLEIPFGVIEQIPLYPGCETLPKEEQKHCVSDKIAQHVNKNFNTKLVKELNLKGKVKINVLFKIDNKGNITDVKARAPKDELVEEAKRIINLLPKFIPGTQSGKAVNVPYSLPIIFQVNE